MFHKRTTLILSTLLTAGIWSVIGMFVTGSWSSLVVSCLVGALFGAVLGALLLLLPSPGTSRKIMLDSLVAGLLLTGLFWALAMVKVSAFVGLLIGIGLSILNEFYDRGSRHLKHTLNAGLGGAIAAMILVALLAHRPPQVAGFSAEIWGAQLGIVLLAGGRALRGRVLDPRQGQG